MNSFFSHTAPIALSVTEGVFYIQPSDIIRLEASSNYTVFYFTNRKPLLIARVLREFEQMLSHLGFIRIHRSHLVNQAHICRIEKTGSVIMNDASRADISRRKKTAVLRQVLADAFAAA
jgi:two-component system, LytTR family, response regulator